MTNNILDDLKLKYSSGNSATKLIYINVVVFFTLLIVDFILRTVANSIINTTDLFALSSFDDLLTKPWQIFSYSWLHGNLFHLIMNMVLLYFVGQMFLQQFQNRNLVTFYIFGGITGGIFFLLFQNIFNYSHLLVGASAAVYAVFFGMISYNPKMPVRLLLIPTSFPLLYVGYFFIAFDVYNIIANQNAGGSISHLGGAIFGYLYMKQFEKGNDFLGNFIIKIEQLIQKKDKSTFKIYKNTSSTSTRTNVPKDDYDFNHQKVEKQKKIDVILDKISRSGYESLSKEEKDFLFKEGR
ncbi:rhomboid family intramembrane serine protease [Empedobacter stercoris]|uniref:Rhomboid family intramembrane serine protease n=1 Tax=Empedobacter stercoris TaxID=1628248 RepID=A0ABX1WKH1_9FLAO|nr:MULTISPECIES: rhomboid family intramembrane serine protease [Empedobacter]MCA4809522.1 rhomboid family intramembrane serine protease [Empedobacter stercoris]MDM1522216.1 rhomboid family intramembrane serine protease [Empedobacter sp. 225-1]MDM1542401.1 rhomboid family intramembrane serine protease [Empedobacter sp. 189-2]NOJ75047.1 rhomboid family intramembrane serine protease [Empedobacter stercoris]QNT14656.1 rhomboid family intramembrane serine protease [Empedobacter stercoris]